MKIFRLDKYLSSLLLFFGSDCIRRIRTPPTYLRLACTARTRSHSAAMQRRYPTRWRYLSAHTRLAKPCVERRQPPLLGRGRDRNQESKSKSRSRSRRGEKHLCNAARVRSQPFVQTFYGQVGEELLQPVDGLCH